LEYCKCSAFTLKRCPVLILIKLIFPNPRCQWNAILEVRINVPQENSYNKKCLTKYRKRLTVAPDMGIHLSNIKPNIARICEEKSKTSLGIQHYKVTS
jgi:hypothetical protein